MTDKAELKFHLTNINNIHDLEQFREKWKEIEQGSDMTIFQSYDWNLLLVEEEKKRKFSSYFSQIVVISICNGDCVVGLVPLIVQKHSNKTKWFGRKRGIYILGHASWSDYLNIIYSDDFASEHFNYIMNFIKQKYNGYTLYVTDIREETRFYEYLLRENAANYHTRVAVQVEKRESAEVYEKSLSKHVRQNLRTSNNRMEKAGVVYELKILGRIDDPELLSRLVDIHVARMAEKNMVTTDFVHRVSSYVRIWYNKRQEYNNNIVKESMRRMNESCLVIVYLNTKIAGYLYGLRDGATIRILQNCVLDEYKFYSPLFRGAYDFILEQYKDDNIKVIDFTRGCAKYKYSLGGVDIKLGSWDI